MNIPNDLHEYQCLGFIPEDVILEFAGFELDDKNLIKGCQDKVVVDFGAGLSMLSSRFLNAKSVSAIDPMYFIEEDELGNNGFRGTSAIIEQTLKRLMDALLKNEEIVYRVDFYGRMNGPCDTIERYKQAVMRLIEDYHDRGEYLAGAEEAIKDVPKFANTEHIEDDSVDILFLNALLFDTDYPSNILSEANRILSPKGEIVIVDYKNIGKNRIYDKISSTDIRIVASDENFYCAKLKKDEYLKLGLWRNSTEKMFPDMRSSSEQKISDSPKELDFNGKKVSHYQKIDGGYLLELESRDRKDRVDRIDTIIGSLSIQKPSIDSVQANSRRREEFEEILKNSMDLLVEGRKSLEDGFMSNIRSADRVGVADVFADI